MQLRQQRPFFLDLELTTYTLCHYYTYTIERESSYCIHWVLRAGVVIFTSYYHVCNQYSKLLIFRSTRWSFPIYGNLRNQRKSMIFGQAEHSVLENNKTWKAWKESSHRIFEVFQKQCYKDIIIWSMKWPEIHDSH